MVKNFIGGAFGLSLVFILGCTTVYESYNPRVGMKFKYSGIRYFKCHVCKEDTNLYKLNKKDKPICDACYRVCKKRYLYR